MSDKKPVLKEKSFLLVIQFLLFYKKLCGEKKEIDLSKQLLQYGTSIGVSIREAQNAESKADLIHKLAISQKVCDETMYGLGLLFKTEFIQEAEFSSFANNSNELLKVFHTSISTRIITYNSSLITCNQIKR